jgi:hypothetical protein
MSTMRITLAGTIFDQRCVNVLHFNNPDGGLSHVQIRDVLIAQWLFHVRDIQNVNFVWRDMTVQKVDGTPDTPTVFPLSDQQGALTGTAAHPSLAALFSVRTAFAGRKGRGRFYVPGVHQESVLNGRVHPNAVIAYNTVANDLVARFGASGSQAIKLVVCPRIDPTDIHTCVTILARSVFGIQRRRNIGVGG